MWQTTEPEEWLCCPGSAKSSKEKRPLRVAFFVLSVQLIRFRGHDEIIFMKTFDQVSPPSDVLMVSIHKVLVWSHLIKILVAKNHKSLVHRLLVNLVVDRNHKTQLLLPVD